VLKQDSDLPGDFAMVNEICLGETLVEGAKEVFETMVFMSLVRSEQSEGILSDGTLLGSITFKGGIEGCLGLCCSQVCARTIAANMLGLDSPEQVGEADISDALGEVVNMVMGAVKSRIQSETGNIEVSIPSVVSGRDLRSTLGEGTIRIVAQVKIEDEHEAELSLLFREAGR
jgi:chemotaxis protein CheX